MPTRTGTLRRDQVAETVRAALVTVLEIDPAQIEEGTSLEQLDADSLVLVEVAEIVEQQLSPLAPGGLHIPDRDLGATRTVGELVDCVLALV